MLQATCQWRATSGTSFNCIVFGVLEEDRGNLDKPQFAGLRWPGSTSVVVLGQGVGDHVLAIRIWRPGSGNQACDFHSPSLAWKHFGEAGNAVPCGPSKFPSSFSAY